MPLILLAEDESPTIDHVRSALSSQGWLVKTVSSRDQALRAASEFAPQLVLINDRLSGAEDLVRTFSRQSGGPGVVLLSSGNGKGTTASDSGHVDAILHKPLETSALIETIRDRLAASKDKKPALPVGESNRIFTSEEIFGDFLGDILDSPEDEGEAEAEPEAAAAAEPEIVAEETPVAAADIPVASLADLEEVVREEVEAFVETVEPVAEATIEEAEVPAVVEEEAASAILDQLQEDLVAEAVVAAAPAPADTASEPDTEGSSLDDTLAGMLAESLSQVSAPEPETASSSDDSAQIDALLSQALGNMDLGPTSLTPTAEAPEVAEEIELEVEAEAEVDAEFELVEDEPEEPVEQAAQEPEPAPARPGVDFGEYSLEEQIGVGGMAEVWKARRQGVEGFEKRVAIKRILPQAAENDEFVEMFIDEAKLAAQLNHTNITHIYDLGKIDNDYFIAMEYVEGKNLRQILDRTRRQESPIPLGVALFIASRLADALDYAHHSKDFDDAELGLVHRDVSPQNVLIGFAGEIKLCDFGIAKAVSKISTTQIGALKGKLQYMSPEQAWGKSIDHRSDIFSLGTLLFEMLSGERLFTGDSEVQILEAVRECDVATRIIQSPNIPAGVKGLLLKALAVEPENRYDSAGELQHGLEELMRDESADAGSKELAVFVQELLGLSLDGATYTPETAEPDEDVGVGEAELITDGAVDSTDEGEKKPWLRRLFTRLLPVILVVAVGGGIIAGLMQRDMFFDTQVPSAPVIEPTPVFDPELVGIGEPIALDSLPPPGESASPSTPAPAQPQKPEPEPQPQTPEVEEPEPAPAEESSEDMDPDLERRVEEELQRVQELMAEPEPFEALEPQAVEPFEAEEPEAMDLEGPAVDEPAPETTEEPLFSLQEALGFSTEIPEESTVEVEEPPQPVATSEPEVQETVTEPEPEPEPQEPTTREGDLVEPGPGVVAPRLLSFRQPGYTPMAQRLGVEGTVRVSVLVDETGKVTEVKLIEGLSQKVGLEDAVMRAARKATFAPATKEGISVKTWHEISVRFKQ